MMISGQFPGRDRLTRSNFIPLYRVAEKLSTSGHPSRRSLSLAPQDEVFQ
jgi:hypothetical protein